MNQLNNKFPPASLKGKFKCNLCRKSLSPKDGDWFEDISDISGQQFFLCKNCEYANSGKYKRFSGSGLKLSMQKK